MREKKRVERKSRLFMVKDEMSWEIRWSGLSMGSRENCARK